MVGPSFAYRGSSGIEPFAHVLLGGIYGRADLSSVGETLFGGPITASDWAFGYAVGGGADFRLSRHVALRGQVDWVRSMFRDGIDDRQNNMKVSGGLVLHLPQ
jgi:opacity protein-like surface antigen